MRFRKTATAALLSITVIFAACNAATVQAYINLAIGIALQVAKLAGLPAAAANQVSGDLSTVNKLIADYQTADVTAKPGKLAEIDTLLNVAENDLTSLLIIARVADSKLQKTIQASIGIAITAVESIRALQDAKQPGPVTQAARRTARVLTGGALPKGKPISPAQLKALYNQTVSDYPQARLQ